MSVTRYRSAYHNQTFDGDFVRYKDYETLLTESKVMRAALEDIHQYEGTSYAHARTVAHQGLSGEYSAQVMQSKCQKCGDTYSGAFCPCSYEVQDDDPAQVGQSSDEKGPAS